LGIRKEYVDRVETLCRDIGKDVDLFLECVICALKEERDHYLTPSKEALIELKQRADAKALFLKRVQSITKRKWDLEEFDCMWSRVEKAYEKPWREPLRIEEKIRLYWNLKEECAECHRKPPDVALHVHHRVPVKHWGSSIFENLQFLCVDCHHKKGNKLPLDILLKGC